MHETRGIIHIDTNVTSTPTMDIEGGYRSRGDQSERTKGEKNRRREKRENE